MKHAKKNIFKTVVVLASLWLLMGFVAADIPGYVDFYAKQTTTYSPPNNPWVIEDDDYGYYPGYDPDDPTVPGTGPQWSATTVGTKDFYNVLDINNRYDPIWHKELWLEIHFNEDEDNPLTAVPFDVTVTAGAPETVEISSATISTEYDEAAVYITKITWMWILDPQPDWETLTFLEADGSPVNVGQFFYNGKASAIASIEVGTYCIPVPGSLLLCGVGLGFIGIVRRLRRR